jgi:heavy metal sensor kinase
MKGYRPQSVRTRLTLWYVGVLASVLLIYIGSASALLFFHLRGQLDHLAIEDLETVEGLLSFAPGGKVLLRSDYHDHPETAQMQERLLEVLANDGSLLFRSESLRNFALGGVPDPGEGQSSYSQRSIRLSDGRRVRLASKRHAIESHQTLIRVGFDEAPLWQNLWQALIGLMAGLPIALGFAGFAGYFLARRALSPIERMARRAHEINGDDLQARLAVENPNDELGLLAQAFNATLGRLERTFEQLRRFTSDAAHELRTPLMALRSVGEAGLQEAATGEEYREVIGSMLEDSARLSRLVDSLLTIARADAGQIRLKKLDTPVISFVREAISVMEVLAEEKEQAVSFEGRSPAQVQADPVILRQVIVNLLDNAIKHTPHGGNVVVRVVRQEGLNIAIEVEDGGPGIPPEHRERVFDRFYRVDDGRAREDGGAGLGLAIAKWGAEAHGGRLELDCPPNCGCIFRLILPVDSELSPEAGNRTAVPARALFVDEAGTVR